MTSNAPIMLKFGIFQYKIWRSIELLSPLLTTQKVSITNISSKETTHSNSLNICLEDNQDVIADVYAIYTSNRTVFINANSEEYYKATTKGQNYCYIITLVSRQAISAAILDHIIVETYQKNYTIVNINSFNNSAIHNTYCYQLIIKGSDVSSLNTLKESLSVISEESKFDYSFQEYQQYKKQRKFICFDMDSTLIQTEVIDELAVCAGVGEQVKAITLSAMRGEIDFKQSFSKRVSLLEGLDESVMITIRKNLPITEGLRLLMSVLHKKQYKSAIFSGGFTYFASELQQQFGFDYIFANNLEIINGRLTGKYIGDVVDAQKKVSLLKEITSKEGISLEESVAVGDGANDLPMINLAGVGVAFHAKPKVREESQFKINYLGLDCLIYYLGLDDKSL